MISRQQESIHKPAEAQKRFGLLLRLVAGGVALLTLSGNQAAAGGPATSYSVLYNFSGGADGSTPSAGLIRDEGGNFYGTTFVGGSSGAGVVFKLDPWGNETVLYSFTGGTDGGNPQAGLIRDEGGNFYGTTTGGGSYGAGVVFKLDPKGKETVLYSFTGGADGGAPSAALIRDSWGNLYGTAVNGGNSSSSCPFGSSGCGVVFKLDRLGKETVLYAFSGGTDGANPYASLIRDEDGNFYGTAEFGGNETSCITYGCGVVFKLDPWGKETVLYAFSGGTDGSTPFAGLAQDAAGNLYGTTIGGGNLISSLCAPFGGCGVIFKLNHWGRETVLYTFMGAADGSTPFGGLTTGDDGLWDPAGNLYGTASFAGSSGAGVVFKLDLSGRETVLHSFNGTDGSLPYLELLLKHHSSLYGTASGGGTYGAGVIFKVTVDDE